MSILQTLSEIAKERAKKQPHQVDEILEEAPVLARLKWEVATHDFHNTAEQVTSVTGATFVPMNAALPSVGASTNLVKVDLSIMGGEIEVPEDTARVFGGKENYFAKKLPKVHKQTGMDTERTIIYRNWHPYCLQNGQAYNAGAANAAEGIYSLMCIRLEAGEHNGLFSPKGFGQGTMLNVMALSGGNLYKSQTEGPLKNVNVYGIRLKAYMGWQILNKKTCAGIFNISMDTPPTEAMIDDALADIRATDSGNSFIVCHPRLLSLLGRTYKSSALRMSVTDKEYNNEIAKWNGVPIFTTYNMDDGTEPFITFP